MNDIWACLPRKIFAACRFKIHPQRTETDVARVYNSVLFWIQHQDAKSNAEL
jgi:hypothetical protein